MLQTVYIILHLLTSFLIQKLLMDTINLMLGPISSIYNGFLVVVMILVSYYISKFVSCFIHDMAATYVALGRDMVAPTFSFNIAMYQPHLIFETTPADAVRFEKEVLFRRISNIHEPKAEYMTYPNNQLWNTFVYDGFDPLDPYTAFTRNPPNINPMLHNPIIIGLDLDHLDIFDRDHSKDVHDTALLDGQAKLINGNGISPLVDKDFILRLIDNSDTKQTTKEAARRTTNNIYDYPQYMVKYNARLDNILEEVVSKITSYYYDNLTMALADGEYVCSTGKSARIVQVLEDYIENSTSKPTVPKKDTLRFYIKRAYQNWVKNAPGEMGDILLNIDFTFETDEERELYVNMFNASLRRDIYTYLRKKFPSLPPKIDEQTEDLFKEEVDIE